MSMIVLLVGGLLPAGLSTKAFAPAVRISAAAEASSQQRPMDAPEADRKPAQPKTLFFSDIGPLSHQPVKETLQPGLSVIYFIGFFRHIDTLPKGDLAVLEGRPGNPIPCLNHQFEKGEIFDSGENRGVGMRMKGFLYIPKAGTYAFQALSNDGIRVHLCGTMIIDDPNVHSDRFSNEAVVEIASSGWHSIQVEYFQRKGTAALKFLWKKPGVQEFEVVPAECFAHIPSKP